ncbi:MAG: hypothetical protein E6G34_00895 [Actinobacteria bacterium]|nr:MAG: hypothetical protein E6G34_00895 [Actinomycetota bacterium]
MPRTCATPAVLTIGTPGCVIAACPLDAQAAVPVSASVQTSRRRVRVAVVVFWCFRSILLVMRLPSEVTDQFSSNTAPAARMRWEPQRSLRRERLHEAWPEIDVRMWPNFAHLLDRSAAGI